MKLDCEGCAGCCVDWRPLSPAAGGTDRRSRRPSLDGAYNLVPLTRDEVAGFLDRGMGDAPVPRLFEPAETDDRVTVQGVEVAAVGDRPVFMVGLRRAPKPVAPVGTDEPRWLETCAFLDPETLQCRIHGDDAYPDTCSTYPGQNLALGVETECERVENAGGGERLLDDEPPEDVPAPAFGPHALGATVFALPDPDRLPEGAIARLREETTTAADRAPFLGAAAGSRPGSLQVDEERDAEAADAVREADSWVGRALDGWSDHAKAVSKEVGDSADSSSRVGLAHEVEDDAGAPSTPGWE